MRPFWDDGRPCSVGCRAPGVIPGWPLKPFHHQHALRAGLNELRDSSLHYGVDIQSRDNVAVYAIQPGRVHVIAPTGPDERLQVGNFIYWHVRIAVGEGQAVAPYRTVLGRTMPGFGHLHLSEVSGFGGYLNPLRPGGRALAPWRDTAPPVMGPPRIDPDGRAHVRAFDPQSFRVRTHYLTPVLMVAALGYRVFDSRGHARSGLEMAYDGSQSLPFSLHAQIFEPDSHRPGFACFARRLICKPVWDHLLAGGLAPSISAAALGSGTYRLSIYAWDWAGNATARDQPFAVRAARVVEGAIPAGPTVTWRPVSAVPASARARRRASRRSLLRRVRPARGWSPISVTRSRPTPRRPQRRGGS